jgi:hypothetical protein
VQHRINNPTTFGGVFLVSRPNEEIPLHPPAALSTISTKEFGMLTLTPLAVVILTLGVLTSIAFPADAPATRPLPTQPDPALSPQQVMRIVLAALKDNNAHDDGIRTTFKFASPENQKVTGPVERFIPMVKSPVYRAMINHKSARVGKVVQKDDRAAAYVLIVGADGHATYFVWQLSKQKQGVFKDCWMTDGVAPVEPPGDDSDDAQKA